MARNRKITQLNPITKPALDDAFAIADISKDETRKVTVRDLNLEIPQPRIRVESVKGVLATGQKIAFNNHDRVHAYWEEIASGFTNCNPEFWLYRYRWSMRKKKTKLNLLDTFHVRTKKQFVHPSHQNGINYANSAFYGGRHDTGDQGRNTEWDINPQPLSETFINLEPWNWYKAIEGSTGVFFGENDFTPNVKVAPVLTGARCNAMKKIQAFKLRIAIDNPDPTSKFPKIFGPFSETFVLYPYKEFGIFTKFKFFVGPEAAPELKRKYAQPLTVLGTQSRTGGQTVSVSTFGEIFFGRKVVGTTEGSGTTADGLKIIGTIQEEADQTARLMAVDSNGSMIFGILDPATNLLINKEVFGDISAGTTLDFTAEGSLEIKGGSIIEMTRSAF